MTRWWLIVFMVLVTVAAKADDVVALIDTTANDMRSKHTVREVVREFDRTEDAYIEPPHYELAVEMRAQRNFEDFILSSNGQSIMLRPDQRIKVGPYFGWRWIFLGTTFDLKNFSIFGDEGKRELNLSVYSSQVGMICSTAVLAATISCAKYAWAMASMATGSRENPSTDSALVLRASMCITFSTIITSHIRQLSVLERVRKSAVARGWQVQGSRETPWNSTTTSCNNWWRNTSKASNKCYSIVG